MPPPVWAGISPVTAITPNALSAPPAWQVKVADPPSYWTGGAGAPTWAFVASQGEDKPFISMEAMAASGFGEVKDGAPRHRGAARLRRVLEFAEPECSAASKRSKALSRTRGAKRASFVPVKWVESQHFRTPLPKVSPAHTGGGFAPLSKEAL